MNQISVSLRHVIDDLLGVANQANWAEITGSLPKLLNHAFDRLDYTNFETHPRSDVVISLTAIPSRIPLLPYVVETLFRQSTKPQKVVIWSSDVDPEMFRQNDSWLSAHEDIEVRSCENIGSHRKHWFCAEAFPDIPIIIVDDDTVYPTYLVEDLTTSASWYAGHVCCFRARTILTDDEIKGFHPYKSWPVVRNSAKGCQILPNGKGGVLYPAEFLADRSLFPKDEMLDLSHNADDLWLKAAAVRSGLSTIVPRDYTAEFFDLPGSQENALWRHNATVNNDIRWQKIVDYFGLTAKDFNAKQLSTSSSSS